MHAIPSYMLRAELIVEPYLGDTAYGAGYGAEVRVKAHFQPKRRVLKTSAGQEIICTAIAYIKPQAELKVQELSRITYQGKTYTVRGAEPYCESYIELTLEP